MTAPDSPSLADVIAETLVLATMTLPSDRGLTQDDIFEWIETKAAAAVVARCQGLTVEHQAELVKADFERAGFDSTGRQLAVSLDLVDDPNMRRSGWHVRSRLATPWEREDPS